MTSSNVTPGPDAHHAFRLGMFAAAIGALVGLAALYWAGLMALPLFVFALVLCFPVYLVFAAVALSVWLGFDKDATDLRPVYPDEEGT